MSSSRSSLLSGLIVHACAGTSTIHLAELQLQSALATAKAAARAAGQAAACCGVDSSRVREAVRKLPASLQGCLSQETATPRISQVRDVQLSEGSLCSLLCSGRGGSAVSLLSELQTKTYHDSSAKPHAALSPRLCPSPGCRKVFLCLCPKRSSVQGKAALLHSQASHIQQDLARRRQQAVATQHALDQLPLPPSTRSQQERVVQPDRASQVSRISQPDTQGAEPSLSPAR